MMETTSTSSNPDLSSEDDADLTQLDKIVSPSTTGGKQARNPQKREGVIDLESEIP